MEVPLLNVTVDVALSENSTVRQSMSLGDWFVPLTSNSALNWKTSPAVKAPVSKTMLMPLSPSPLELFVGA